MTPPLLAGIAAGFGLAPLLYEMGAYETNAGRKGWKYKIASCVSTGAAIGFAFAAGRAW